MSRVDQAALGGSSLADAIRRYADSAGGDGPFATAIDDLTLLRSDRPKRPSHLLFRPALCMVAQGTKSTSFGDRRFDYRAGQALVVTAESPGLSGVVEASAERPFLGAVVELDTAVLAETLAQMKAPPRSIRGKSRGVFVADDEGSLADCVLRAIRLLGNPDAIAALYPGILREICFRLLSGPHGGDIAHLALATGRLHGLIGAVHTLRDRFAETISIGELAGIAQLSLSAFHRRFKALTAMTPLQYQKQMRLLEARRLMIAETMSAENAAFRVGYESASQFSREYARMFGSAPRRDVAALRARAA